MDEETIPLEAGIESRAISLTKGCYVGQEVIIRVLHRGHGRVARKLVGLTLEGAAVPPSERWCGGRPRCRSRHEQRHVTALGRPIALAYVTGTSGARDACHRRRSIRGRDSAAFVGGPLEDLPPRYRLRQLCAANT